VRCGAQEAKKPDFSGLFWHSSMSVSNDGVAAERERFVGLIRVKLQRRLVGQKHGPRCQTIAVTAPTRTPGVLPCSRPRYRGPVAPRRAATGCEPGPYGVLVTGTSTAQDCCWLRCGSKPLAMRQWHSGEHRPTASNLGCSAAGGPGSSNLAWPRSILQKRPRESTGMSCHTSEHPGPAPGRCMRRRPWSRTWAGEEGGSRKIACGSVSM